jgi:hypothetical protein
MDILSTGIFIKTLTLKYLKNPEIQLHKKHKNIHTHTHVFVYMYYINIYRVCSKSEKQFCTNMLYLFSFHNSKPRKWF